MQTLQWHRDTDTNQTLLPLCSRRWNNKWLHSLYLHLLWFIIYKASFSSRAQRHIFCICHSSEGQMRAYSFSVIHELYIQVLVLNIWRILCVFWVNSSCLHSECVMCQCIWAWCCEQIMWSAARAEAHRDTHLLRETLSGKHCSRNKFRYKDLSGEAFSQSAVMNRFSDENTLCSLSVCYLHPCMFWFLCYWTDQCKVLIF